MKLAAITFRFLLLVALLPLISCEPDSPNAPLRIGKKGDLAIYARYAPAKVDILPLSEIIPADEKTDSKIKIYVSFLDAFGHQTKSPAVFRFELHEFIQYAAKPKGERIEIWPDIILTKPEKNNKYWDDFLRAYEFELDFRSTGHETYVMQITCICPNSKRLSAQINLKTN